MDSSEVMTTDLTELRNCRICLRETEQPIDQELRTTLSNCFERSTENTLRYPNFVCEECRDFLKKCREFSGLCTRSKWHMMQFSKTGTWPGELTIPSWLKAAPKRQPQQEDAATPIKEVCDGTQEKSVIGPYGSLMGQSSIPSSAMQGQYSAEHVIRTQHSQDHSIIQQPFPQFGPSPVQATDSQTTSSNSQQLQQFPPYPIQYMYRPSYQPQQQQQQQQLQPPFMSFGQPGTLHSTAQAVSLEPLSKPPAVARHPQTIIGPIQPTPWIPCRTCLLLFASREHLKYHIRKHYDCKRLKVYREMFAHPEKGIEHLKESNRMWCRFCRTKFSDEPSLDEHLNQHVKANLLYCCDFCLLLFVDWNSLQRHLHNDHREELREFLKRNPHINM